MKKIILFSIIIFSTLSCSKKEGSISGEITYYTDNYTGFRPDSGAIIYVTSINADTLFKSVSASNCFYSISHLNCCIDDTYQKLDSYMNDESMEENYEIIDELGNTISMYEEAKLINEDRLLQCMKDTCHYKEMLGVGEHLLQRIINDSKQTYKAKANEYGAYTIDVPIGDYWLIIVSKGSKADGIQKNGRMDVHPLAITTEGKYIINVEFDASI